MRVAQVTVDRDVAQPPSAVALLYSRSLRPVTCPL